MRTLLLICISAALGAVAIAKVDNPELLRRLEKNGKSLNKLVARAVRLADTVSRRKNERDQAETDAQNMLQRIERRNGGICSDNQFVCGGAAGQCVDNLVVCDGKKDCDNGADEADVVCTNPLSPGSTFEGVTVYDKCTQRQPHSVSLHVLSGEKRSRVKSNILVKARLNLQYTKNGAVGQDSLPLEGLYYFGKRRLEFASPEDDRLGVDIEFPPGENDVIIAYAVREASGERCAKFMLKRK